jgi:hypothetical protein
MEARSEIKMSIKPIIVQLLFGTIIASGKDGM